MRTLWLASIVLTAALIAPGCRSNVGRVRWASTAADDGSLDDYVGRAPLSYEEGQSKYLLDDAAGQAYARYAGVDALGRVLSSVTLVENKIRAVDVTGKVLQGADLVGVGIWAVHPGTAEGTPMLKLTIEDVKATDQNIDPDDTTEIVFDPSGKPHVVTHTHSELYKVHAYNVMHGRTSDIGELCQHVPPNLWTDGKTGLTYQEYALAIPQIWSSQGWLENMDSYLENNGVGAGDWTQTAHNPAGFSFACMTGAVAKCARIGYWPGRARTMPNGDALMDYDMSRLHQACTKMYRANYCLEQGRSFTRSGTPIEIGDIFGVHTLRTLSDPTVCTDKVTTNCVRVAPDDQFYQAMEDRFGHDDMGDSLAHYREPSPFTRDHRFEGAFDEHGPVCLSRTRWTDLLPDLTCMMNRIDNTFPGPVADCHSYNEAIYVHSYVGSPYVVFNRSDINVLPAPPTIAGGGGGPAF
jgi:hypothetical protein